MFIFSTKVYWYSIFLVCFFYIITSTCLNFSLLAAPLRLRHTCTVRPMHTCTVTSLLAAPLRLMLAVPLHPMYTCTMISLLAAPLRLLYTWTMISLHIYAALFPVFDIQFLHYLPYKWYILLAKRPFKKNIGLRVKGNRISISQLWSLWYLIHFYSMYIKIVSGQNDLVTTNFYEVSIRQKPQISTFPVPLKPHWSR